MPLPVADSDARSCASRSYLCIPSCCRARGHALVPEGTFGVTAVTDWSSLEISCTGVRCLCNSIASIPPPLSPTRLWGLLCGEGVPCTRVHTHAHTHTHMCWGAAPARGVPQCHARGDQDRAGGGWEGQGRVRGGFFFLFACLFVSKLFLEQKGTLRN